MLERLSQLLPHAQAGIREWRSACGRLRSLAPALSDQPGSAMDGAWGRLRRASSAALTVSALAGDDSDLAFTIGARVRCAARPAAREDSPTGRPVATVVTDAPDDAAGTVCCRGTLRRATSAQP